MTDGGREQDTDAPSPGARKVCEWSLGPPWRTSSSHHALTPQAGPDARLTEAPSPTQGTGQRVCAYALCMGTEAGMQAPHPSHPIPQAPPSAALMASRPPPAPPTSVRHAARQTGLPDPSRPPHPVATGADGSQPSLAVGLGGTGGSRARLARSPRPSAAAAQAPPRGRRERGRAGTAAAR